MEFQSTHPRGVRRAAIILIVITVIRFNPRTREGCDEWLGQFMPQYPVSIHAPARGATPRIQNLPSFLPCFNPRTREGCDRQPCQGRRPAVCFNPRTREGCDHCQYCGRHRRRSMFQSTHPRGVRLCSPCTVYKRGRVSIHAPARGATIGSYAGSGDFLFQSTHPRGVRPYKRRFMGIV